MTIESESDVKPKAKVFRAHPTALLAASWLFVAPVALAQSSANGAAAQGLFDEAKALMAAGNAAEACPKFEESQKLDPGSGTLVNLARCYEQTGRLASAWSTYLEAAVAAKAAGNPEREGGAREQAAALAPRVSKIVVNVPPEARVPGLEITRDGTAVGPAQWGVAIPGDEGEHLIAAKAPGYRDWQAPAALKGEGATIEVSVPKLTEAERPEAPRADDQAQRDSATVDHPPTGLGTQRTLAIVSGGVGIVGLGIGTIFALKTMSSHSEAEKYCNGTACTDLRGVSAGKDAHSAGNIATIGMVVGAVGLAGGVTLWFTAPEERPSTEVSLGIGTVRLEGTW